MTGPDPDAQHGLGRGGEPLHRWAVESDDEVDRAVLEEATVADELRIHLAPVVLGGGTPLFLGSEPFPLIQRSVRASSTATHLIYDVMT